MLNAALHASGHRLMMQFNMDGLPLVLLLVPPAFGAPNPRSWIPEPKTLPKAITDGDQTIFCDFPLQVNQ